MPLTPAEKIMNETARLEELIAALMVTMRGNDNVKKRAALNALTDFGTETLDPALRERADDARAAGANTLMAAGLRELADITTRLSPLGATFEQATHIAVTGKKDLLFPRLAASASTMLQVVTELEAATKAVKNQVGNVNELGDVPAAIENVKSALETLRTRVKQAQG